MAASSSKDLFDEDEVCYVSNEDGYRCGIVTEYAYSSSDSDDDDDFGLKKGFVRVAWHPEGNEERVKANDLNLADRSLMPGDVVRRLREGSDSDSARGYVRFTDVSCHVQVIGTNKIISNVNSKDLEPVQFWDLSPSPKYVLLDSWLGRVEDVAFNITVRLPDGARCRYNEDSGDLFGFVDVRQKKSSEFYKDVFYPGQELRGAMGELRDVQWLNPTKMYNAKTVSDKYSKRVTVVVEQVEPSRTNIQWLCCGAIKAGDSQGKLVNPPARLKKSQIKRLKVLNIFERCSTQLGDRFFYTIKDTDVIQDFSSKKRKNLIHYVMKGEEDVEVEENLNNSNEQNTNNQNSSQTDQQTNYNDQNNLPPEGASAAELAVADDNEYEDVDDDSDAESLSSSYSDTSSSSMKKGKKKRKGPALQTKLMKKKGKRARKRSEPLSSMKTLRSGDRVDVEVIYTSTQVEVMWQDCSIERDISSVDLFPVHHIDDTEMFFPGDLVLPNTESYTPGDEYGMVGNVDYAGRTCMVTWRKPKQSYEINPNEEIMGEEEANGKEYYVVREEVSVYDIKEHPDYKFRPGDVVVRIGTALEESEDAAGQVYELNTDGTLNVMWPSGHITSCRPWQIFLVGDDMSDLDDTDWDSSDTSSTDSWETESETELDAEELPVENDKNDDTEKKVEASQLLERCELISKKVAIAFNHNVGLEEYFIDCYREIIRIYRSCKRFDRMLEKSFFRDSKLLSAINDIRDELGDARDHRQSVLPQILDIQEKLRSLEKVYGEFKKRKEEGGGDAESSQTGQTGEGAEAMLCQMLDTVLSSSPGQNIVVTESGDNNVTVSVEKTEVNGDDQNGSALLGATSADCNMDNELRQIEGELRNTEDSVESLYRNTASSQSGENDNQSRKKSSDSDDEDAGEMDPEAAKAKEIKLANIRARKLCDNALKILKERIQVMNAEIEKSWHKVNKLKHESSMNFGDGEEAGTSGEKTATEDGIEENPCENESAGEGAASSEVVAEQKENTDTKDSDKFVIEGFTLLESVPESHKYTRAEHHPIDRKTFFSAVKKELKLLNTSLPKGIIVKGYEDRMDLFSVMIVGPEKTPYEDGLFFFEVQLPNDYPSSPPLVHYISFCSGQLNPNLYEDGKVCVSLLGTWTGKGNEMWTVNSNLLQVLVSIQGLILVSEPYYNEAGYEKQRGSQQAAENSRMYNEMAIIKLQQAVNKQIVSPPEVFREEVLEHYRQNAQRIIKRLESWMSSSNAQTEGTTASVCPDVERSDFPLQPVSRGFCITLRKHLSNFHSVLKTVLNIEDLPKPDH